jgi:hypothetical protein
MSRCYGTPLFITVHRKVSRLNPMNTQILGARGGAVVEELGYKPEGRGIDSRWCQWNFSLT